MIRSGHDHFRLWRIAGAAVRFVFFLIVMAIVVGWVAAGNGEVRLRRTVFPETALPPDVLTCRRAGGPRSWLVREKGGMGEAARASSTPGSAMVEPHQNR